MSATNTVSVADVPFEAQATAMEREAGLSEAERGQEGAEPSGRLEGPEEQEQGKQAGTARMLTAMLAANVLAQMLYLNVAALLPEFVHAHHPTFDSLSVGVLLAAYQVSFLLVAPFIGGHLATYGHRRALHTSIAIFAAATTVYGAAGFIRCDAGFYAVSLVARLCQGVADALMQITIPAVIAREFPRRQEQYQGLFYTSLGLGLTLGPFASWGLSELGFGYATIFFIFAGVILVIGTPLVASLPSHLDHSHTILSSDEPQPLDVPFAAFLKNPRALMALLAYCLVAIVLIFYDPILSRRMEALGVSPNQSGLAFATMSGTFALASPFMGILAQAIDNRALIAGGFFGLTGSVYLTSSPPALGSSLVVSFVGLALNGVCVAAVFTPVIPEMVSVMLEEYGKKQSIREMDGVPDAIQPLLDESGDVIPTNIPDKAPALAEMAFAVGSIIGPVLGGGLKAWRGYEFAVMSMVVVSGAFTIVYFAVTLRSWLCNSQLHT